METTPLPLTVATLYAELLQQVKSAEAERSIGDLRGTFVGKKIKDKNYWYLQFNEAGRQKQVYLGPESAELLRTIKKCQEGKKLKVQDEKNRRTLVRMLVKGGAAAMDALSARIIDLLAESGLFRFGGVLVGTHAFSTYAGMLGVTWPTALKTQDVDVAQEKSISVALSRENVQTNLPDVLERAEMGFHPIPALNPKNPSTSFKILGKEMHLDILTPLIGPESGKPVFLPALNLAAQPLRHLDYLIEETEQAVIPFDDGILVNVPTPARFAFHKLLVAQKRPASNQTKIRKDIEQSSLLFAVLLKERPQDVEEAWRHLKARGKKWALPAKQGLKQIKSRHPEIVTPLSKIITS